MKLLRPSAARRSIFFIPTKWALCLWLIGLWILTHPYAGIIHDSVLYTARALHALTPDMFAGDLFFAYGSDSSQYTFFPLLYAFWIDWLGVGTAALFLTVSAQLCWLTALLWLLRQILRGRVLWLTALLIAALPGQYGGYHALGYGEPFLTARPFAEAAVFLALGLLYRRRLAAALLMLGIATALHPLMAIPGWGVAWLYLVLRQFRWFWLMPLAIMLTIVLALLGVEPFVRVLAGMDGHWRAIAEARSPLCFPGLWEARDWHSLAFAGAILAAALSGLRRPRFKILLSSIFLSGWGGILLAWLGGDIFNNQLMIQLEFWRSTWLLHLFSYSAGAWLGVQLWRKSGNGKILLLLWAAAWFSQGLLLSPALSLLALIFTVLDLRGRLFRLSRLFYLVSFTLGAGTALAWVALYLFAALMSWEFQGDLRNAVILAGRLLLVAAVIQLFSASRLQRKLAWLAPLALAVGMFFWDQRSAWDTWLETKHPTPPLSISIPPQAQIYWENDIKAVWLLLLRSSYISSAQGTRATFSRQTAETFMSRMNLLDTVNVTDTTSRFMQRTALHQERLTLTHLATACRAHPMLDFMVLRTPVAGAVEAVWHPPLPYRAVYFGSSYARVQEVSEFYLYDCQKFR